MIKFTAHAYLVECLSNLHAGSGDNNYAVIDKQVQRDTISHLPVIHASGLKGAFREYFRECVDPNETNNSAIFGSDKNDKENMQQGAYRFFEARMLLMPVRGVAKDPYYLAASEEGIRLFNNTARDLGFGKEVMIKKGDHSAETEFGSMLKCIDTSGILPSFVLADNTDMENMLKHLPVIARNSLDNGQSENLWYEEVLPRETRLYFFVLVPDNAGVDFETGFNRHVDGKTVQIGANATVGYGYCKISKIV
ncbi:MAG: type III-B CRISPR module RAMP protein Cmr4 [Chitinophagaceae bacterium]|nr:type III-B CRISPR module RAMP protein Cmr4 [Chitinophagaceae bacterium]